MEKFLIPAKENDIQSEMDNHFGQSKWYLVMNSEGELLNAVPGDQHSHHTGIYKAKDRLNFTTILTPHMGPHAFEAAEHRGLKIYLTSPETTVLDAIGQYKEGTLTLLTSVEGLSCGSHHR